MSAPVLVGAEPLSVAGSRQGALVLHGFTGNPFSMRPIAAALAAEGYSVEMPLLPGHGTDVADMMPTRFDDWSSVAEAAYADLAARCDRVAVVGLSMGGTLTLFLAETHPEIAGIALINPLAESPDPEFRDGVAAMVDAGTLTVEGIGSDIAKPDVVELSYGETPLAPLVSLLDAADKVGANLADVRCPVLLLSSREDHVVPTPSGDRVEREVTGPVERFWLEKSFHVATLDYDAEEVISRCVQFVGRVTSPDGE